MFLKKNPEKEGKVKQLILSNVSQIVWGCLEACCALVNDVRGKLQ